MMDILSCTASSYLPFQTIEGLSNETKLRAYIFAIGQNFSDEMHFYCMLTLFFKVLIT
jgi:hypothetical protein